jgi:lipid II isoglutaminyl synthase (glutamine-hydrolysing)
MEVRAQHRPVGAAAALGLEPGGLPALDDALEDAAHAAARRAAGV